MEDGARLPRILDLDFGITIVAHHTQECGVLEVESIATGLRARTLAPAAGGKQ